ncbi:UNVERIFIED_CONTAM: hypothetical protein GTU68_044218 [Idotea baltica]|nr:hypothetical protein [Idotea baltica]
MAEVFQKVKQLHLKLKKAEKVLKL